MPLQVRLCTWVGTSLKVCRSASQAFYLLFVSVQERAAGALANLFNDHSANVHQGFQQAPTSHRLTVYQSQVLLAHTKLHAAWPLRMEAAGPAAVRKSCQASEMIPSLVALIQEAGLSEDAKRQAAHALAMLAAEDRLLHSLSSTT